MSQSHPQSKCEGNCREICVQCALQVGKERPLAPQCACICSPASCSQVEWRAAELRVASSHMSPGMHPHTSPGTEVPEKTALFRAHRGPATSRQPNPGPTGRVVSLLVPPRLLQTCNRTLFVPVIASWSSAC